MTSALIIKDLKKTYASGTQALKGINLQVEAGDFFALLGPNGAGKTTLIGIVTALVNKTAGEVSVFGHDIAVDVDAAKACIGLVPQEFNLNIFEAAEQIVVTQAGYYGIPRKLAKERAKKYLTQLGLWEKRKQPPRNLSGGMKRRLMIARALIHEPKLLILDEPTAGVDIEIRRATWKFLREVNAQGTTIILTTHYLEEAENLCKNIAIIDHGDIVQRGSMREVLDQLKVETFVFYLEEAVKELPGLSGYQFNLVDDFTLEVDVSIDQGVTMLLEALVRQNVKIRSMRNKHNRLEELFVRLVTENEK